MELSCKECGYILTKKDRLTSKCPKCGSIYLIDKNAKKRKGLSPVQRWRNSENKKWKKVQLLGSVFLFVLILVIIYVYVACKETDANTCPRLARSLLGLVRIIARLFS